MMNRRIVFVKLSIDSGYPCDFNHGIACLVPIARKHSYDVAYLSFCDKISHEDFRNKIVDLDPSIAACITLDPEWVFSQSAIKGACIGEGELPLDELLSNIKNGKDIEDTKGFYWHLNGKKTCNAVPQFVPDLSVLDFPDYSIFDREVVVRDNEITMMFGRGCPYSCYYCGNAALRSVYPSPKGYWRIPVVEYCMKLLERTLKQYPETKSIIFADDLLIANKTWFEEFASEYGKRIKTPYKLCGRAEYITTELVKTLKQSGCVQVSIGVESGNEHFRKTMLNRKHSNSEIIEKCRMIKDAGLYLYTFCIVGFPFEDRAKIEDTYNLLKELEPNDGHCSYYFPYRRTELYKRCKEANLLKSEEEMAAMTNFYKEPAIKMTPAQEKDCIGMRKKILVYFAKNHKRYKRRKKVTEATAHLHAGIKKSFFVTYYSAVVLLLDVPLLYKIIRFVYILFGVRALKRCLVKNKP